MSLFSSKLDQLETRLQTLIEGRLARLIPQQSHEALIQRLVTAMKEGVQQPESGYPLAPDVYFLIVHPESEPGFLTNSPFLQGLATVIHEAGADAGLRFIKPPVVNISSNPDIEPHQIEIIARTSEGSAGETVSITLSPHDAQENIPANAFLIVNGVRIFTLDRSPINIGRRSDNELVIDDPRVSRHHAQLRAVRNKYMIFDLDSTGGTFVNGKRVSQFMLNPQDVISLAGVPLVYGQEHQDTLGETQKFEILPPSDQDQPTQNHPL